eukprot:COSAG02_NODE_3440_length_6739_cov_10.354819_4_plen_58_part_00
MIFIINLRKYTQYSSHKVNVRIRHYLELLSGFDRESALLRDFYGLINNYSSMVYGIF